MNVPILMIAKACGAAQRRAAAPERGANEIALTGAGQSDPPLDAVRPVLHACEWHADTSDVLAGGSLLAISRGRPNADTIYNNFHEMATGEAPR